jgi:hypothetical protein
MGGISSPSTSGQEIFQVHVRPWHDDVPFTSNFKDRKIRHDLLVTGQLIGFFFGQVKLIVARKRFFPRANSDLEVRLLKLDRPYQVTHYETYWIRCLWYTNVIAQMAQDDMVGIGQVKLIVARKRFFPRANSDLEVRLLKLLRSSLSSVTSGQEIFQVHVRPWHDDVPFTSNFKDRKIRHDHPRLPWTI